MKPDQKDPQEPASKHEPQQDRAPHAGRPITGPLLDELTKQKREPDFTEPTAPPKAAELDQDPGGGYNLDHTIPQP